jgi:hypothetical protein
MVNRGVGNGERMSTPRTDSPILVNPTGKRQHRTPPYWKRQAGERPDAILRGSSLQVCAGEDKDGMRHRPEMSGCAARPLELRMGACCKANDETAASLRLGICI